MDLSMHCSTREKSQRTPNEKVSLLPRDQNPNGRQPASFNLKGRLRLWIDWVSPVPYFDWK